MQVYELLRLTEWFKTNIVKAGIPDKYSALHNAMNKNVKRASNQQAQPFQNEKESLIEAIKPINFKSLSIEQIHFLEKLDVTELLGEIGANKIEEVLFINNLDLASATKEIGNFSKKINSAQNTLNQISETLGKSFSIEDDREIEPEHVMMRVYFQDKQSIKNLSDFKKLSVVWYDIGRGISMAMNKSPEDFKIIGAQKGSIIVAMAISYGVAKVVSLILLEGLKVADRVLDILKKHEEIKALKLGNEKIHRDLKKEAKKEKEDGVKSILEKTISELGIDTQNDGDKVNALKKAIEKLIDFTENGGAVDIVQPDEPEENDEEDNGELRNEVRSLKENISEIRQLEQKFKLLESKKDSDDEAES